MNNTQELDLLLKKSFDKCKESGNKTIEIAHFLLTCLNDENKDNLIYKTFSSKISPLTKVRDRLEGYIKSEYPTINGNFSPFNSVDLERLIVGASRYAKDDKVGIKEVFISMFDTQDQFIKDLLTYYFNKEDIEDKIEDKSTPNLLNYCSDMIEECKNGKILPLIGRNIEIRTIMEVLSKQYKNNPFLKGDPGVGKTAIVEGLAYRIFKGDVSENLKGVKIFRLNNNLLASTDSYKGDLARTIETIVQELKSMNGKAILFIDEAHTLFQKGGSGTNIADMIRSAIEKGDAPIICATTNEEFATHFASDKSLLRRFQPIDIKEPSMADAISILRGIKSRFEGHHNIKIYDEAIVDAVKSSIKYINNRRLPDKAIDLLDQACATVKIGATLTPSALDETVRKISQIEIEINSLKQDGLNRNAAKIASLEKEKQGLEKIEKELFKDYKEKQSVREKIQEYVNQIVSLEEKANFLSSNGKLEEASKIKFVEIPPLQKKIEDLKNNPFEIIEKDVVKSKDVFAIISRWTGIPVFKLEESEAEKYLKVEEELKKRVMGQNEALKVISDSIIRSTAGIASPNKPIGSFLFVGPTGVGKTESAKALAELLFDDEKKMIRLDMSEFQQEHMVQRLTGAPAGYVGYDDGGQLTEAVKRNPYSVILLDEIEKAHPKVWDAFLQIFDDGRLTDAKGETVDFTNTIIIMTSNIGGRTLLEGNSKENRQKVWEEIKQSFRPEFINRLDNIVYFNTLSMESKKQIVDKFLNEYINRLSENGYKLEFSQKIKEVIINESFDENFGARPIKKYIEDKIGTFISKSLLSNPQNKYLKVEYDEINGFNLSIDEKTKLVSR